MQNNVTILTERTKALKTPARFIGSVETQEVNKLIVTEDLKSVTEKTINFNQGLFKIVEEVFDNALDECKRHRNNADSKKKGIGNVVSYPWITSIPKSIGIFNLLFSTATFCTALIFSAPLMLKSPPTKPCSIFLPISEL